MKFNFFKSKLFKRYLLGFMLVFIFPVAVLAATYYFYFLPSYTEKILNIYEEQSYRSGTFVETLLKNIDSISQQLILSKSDIWKEVRDPISIQRRAAEQLTSLSLSNENFESIHLYNLSADIIYTENGTYSPEYYHHFCYDGEVVDLAELVQRMRGSAMWFTGDDIRNAQGGSASRWQMLCVRPLTSNGCLIFSVNVPYVQIMVENEVMPFVLLDRRQILPADPVSEPDMRLIPEQNTRGILKYGDEYRVYYRSELYDLLCVYRIPSEIIAESIHPVARIFIFVFSLISVLGGALIFYMTLASYRPIQRVKETVVGAQSDPSNLSDDLDAIHQSFEQLQNRILDSARQAEESRVLMKLFYARNELPASLREECAHIGIQLDADHFYVLYAIHFANNLDDPLEESTVFVKSMTYTAGSSQLVLIGVQEANVEEIPFILRSHIERTQGCRFILSRPCDSAEMLADCYSDVIQTAARISEDAGQFILCHRTSSESEDFIFPRSEIKALFHALSTSNIENALLILDNLSAISSDETIDEFYRFSVYADAVNTGIDAFDSVGRRDVANELRRHAVAYSKKMLDLRSIRLDFNAIKEILISYGASAEGSTEKMMDVLEFIRKNRNNPSLNVSMVADEFGLSQSNLSHQFKTRFDLRISDYIRQMQIEYACELLGNSEMSVAEISESLGFTQISSFIRKFKQETGLTPNQYRQREQDNHS